MVHTWRNIRKLFPGKPENYTVTDLPANGLTAHAIDLRK